MSGDRLLPDPFGAPPPEAPPQPERPNWPPPRPDQQQPVPAAFQPPPPQEPPSGQAKSSTPYTARFQLILGALLGLGAVAIVAALMLFTGPAAKDDGDWSAWSPSSDDRGEAAQQIAQHVAPSYRLDGSGGQLVAVNGGDLEVAELPVRVALADPGDGNVSVLNGDGVMYTLCGLGPKCSINTGTPSPQRHLLLRREALELALYTFRYVRGTDYVVALLPPRKGDDPTQAMFFRKEDLDAELDRPLTATLPSPPPTSNALGAREISTLQALTDNRLFQFKYEQGQDASVFLVLSPLVG